MYALYLEGHSLEDVADAFKVTRQSVFERFRRQDLPRRPRRRPLPFVEFDGARYAPGKDDYFRKTDGDRELLHHAIWIKANGPIPRAHVVTFLDGDRMNTVLENLECVYKGEERHVQPITLKPCLACGELMIRRSTGNTPESPSAYAKRKTCNLQCSGEWKRGRLRGSRMNDVSLLRKPWQLRLPIARMADERDHAAARELDKIDPRSSRPLE